MIKYMCEEFTVVYMKEASNPVRSLQKTVRILETLKEQEGTTLSELAANLDYSKGTIHNHLATLVSEEFVVQNGDEYNLGLRFFEFGEHTRKHQPIHEVAKPEVRELAEKTGELSSLLVEEHGWGLYLHREYGENSLTLDTKIGTRVHLHNTALGKAILAFLPENKVERIISTRGLPKTGPNTINTEGGLYERLDEVREKGYAVDMEERTSGVRCIAAPVQVQDGTVKGAVSIAGPKSRLTESKLHEEYAEYVTNAATVIGVNLTYQ